jgi:hypothetical protein
MHPKSSLPRWQMWTVLLVSFVGCTPPDSVDDRLEALNPDRMVPVKGVVTVNGKPRNTVVLTFLPRSGLGVANAETDQDGKYQLQTQGRDGALPGDYKVSISYLVSDKGEPQGLGPRSGQVQPPSMLTAKELLPIEYSDLGRTKLTAAISPQGGEFNFDVPASIPDVPEKSAGKTKAGD